MLHYLHKLLAVKKSRAQQQGFILLAVLVLILIFSMFGLYALTRASLSIKMQADAVEESTLKTTAQSILKGVEKKIKIDMPTCLIQTRNAALFAKYPHKWWENYACNGHFKHVHYFYVIEHLGDDNCAILNDVSVEYFRITLLAHLSNKSQIILQSTIAKGKNSPGVCIGEKHHLMLGRQMQRELFRRIKT